MHGREAWSRRGLMLEPPSRPPWAKSHAALPAIDAINEGTWLYFSPRDLTGRAHIARVRVDLGGQVATRLDPEPVLGPGPRGCFDEAGVTMSCLVKNGQELVLFYTGWSLGRSVPFQLAVGSATSVDGGSTFRRDSPAPLLDRNTVDPYLTASPFVRRDDGRWRMWYVSGTGWRDDDEPCYLIKYAESEDGRHWNRDGLVCIDYDDKSEHAISRPWVIRDADMYRMWFASRGLSYRIH